MAHLGLLKTSYTCVCALQENDGCDYVIVIQHGEGLYVPDPLPSLPPNARYLPHENKCFDIGTVGWVLENLGSFIGSSILRGSVQLPFSKLLT